MNTVQGPAGTTASMVIYGERVDVVRYEYDRVSSWVWVRTASHGAEWWERLTRDEWREATATLSVVTRVPVAL